jgi:hypothetical protein
MQYVSEKVGQKTALRNAVAREDLATRQRILAELGLSCKPLDRCSGEVRLDEVYEVDMRALDDLLLSLSPILITTLYSLLTRRHSFNVLGTGSIFAARQSFCHPSKLLVL